MQNTLVKIPIVLGGNWLWSSRSNWTPKSKFTPFSARPCHYPTLGCDIQGFRAPGVKCPTLTTVVPGFPAIWLGVPFGASGAHLGICTLPEKNLRCVWNKLFLGEIKFSQRRTLPVKSLWWQIVPMQESTNELKNLTFFLNNGTCGNTMVKPQTVRYRLIK